MSVKNLKASIHQIIENVDDPELLETVSDLLQSRYKSVDLIHLTDEQEQAIDAAREQIRSGNFLTDEQANMIVDRWLNPESLELP